MRPRRCLSTFLFSLFLCILAIPSANSQSSAPASTSQSSSSIVSDSPEEVAIPGPLRSFLRMAAISQKASPEEVLPLLSRNVVVNGFQGGSGKPTEFLILLNWYMDQARELLAFAGPEGVIHMSPCAE